MTSVPQAGFGRNACEGRDHLHHHDNRRLHELTRGGREVFRRTGWSSPVCNVVADLAGLSSEILEG